MEDVIIDYWSQPVVSPIIRLEDPAAAASLPSECLRFPISPNAIIKDKGKLLRPRPPFPFSNCFHTIGSEMHVRVKVRCEPEPGYKVAGRVELTSKDHKRIESCLPEDTLRNWIYDFSDRLVNAGWLKVTKPFVKYVRPEIEKLNVSNWGDPIVDMWYQLDEQFSESCIPASAQILGEELEKVQQ